MSKLIIPAFFIVMCTITLMLARFIIAEKLDKGDLEIANESTTLKAKQVLENKMDYDPERTYTLESKVKRTYTREGLLSWSVKHDTLSAQIIGKK